MVVNLSEYRLPFAHGPREGPPTYCFGLSRRLNFPKILGLDDERFREFYATLMRERYGGKARPSIQLILCDACGHNIACFDEIRELGGRPLHPHCSRERYAALTTVEAGVAKPKKLMSRDQMSYLRRVSELGSLR